eukprot:scaffold7727_cov258-Pinguiococcus_pyrenoidosus.AAC.3
MKRRGRPCEAPGDRSTARRREASRRTCGLCTRSGRPHAGALGKHAAGEIGEDAHSLESAKSRVRRKEEKGNPERSR